MVTLNLRDPNIVENSKAVMGLKRFGYSNEEIQKLYDEQVKTDKEKAKVAMIEKIGLPAMLEQLAEEAAELAQAALKYARVLRDENPTPTTEMVAKENLIEEFTDVIQCSRELDLHADEGQMKMKQQRFYDRWGAVKLSEEKER